ncbi:MAG: hypothetical protein WCT47_17815 [Betaproteobacteria bacterium]
MAVVSVIRQLLGSVAGIAATRLELLVLEIEQERLNVARLWIRATVTLFLLFAGTVLGVGGLLLWAEPSQRAAIATGLALGFLAAAAAAAWSWHRLAQTRRPLLSGIRRDLQGLRRGQCGADDSGDGGDASRRSDPGGASGFRKG